MEGEKPAETVEVANQSTPVNIETSIVEPVQEQSTCESEIAKYDWVQSTALGSCMPNQQATPAH